ncbi:hypothetical protein EDD22DRAFT_778772, partial [Suillus occidentalis]
RQAQTEKILKQLDAANLGSGLLVVGNTKNDLGRGPVMIKQTFNPREINKGTISKMSHNRAAHGLLNHFVGNAITIMVDPKYIKGGLQGFKSDAYNNHVEWADAAKEDNAEMMLLNGNHRVTLMADTFEDEFYISASNSKELLHELSANAALPSKDDSETERLRNYIRIRRDAQTEEERQQLKVKVLGQWTLENSTGCIRPAWVANHTRLFSFIVDLFSVEELEKTKHMSIYLSIFRPMLSSLLFLVSPVMLTTQDLASRTHISQGVVGLREHPEERKAVIEMMHRMYQPLLKQVKHPLVELLGKELMIHLDDTFSKMLSPHMHLFGSMDEPEVVIYQDALEKYWRALRDGADKINRRILANNPHMDELSRIVLENMGTKILWLELGFDPMSDHVLGLETLPPLLTELTFPSMMSNWKSDQLGKRGYDTKVDLSKVMTDVSRYITWDRHACMLITLTGAGEPGRHGQGLAPRAQAKTVFCHSDAILMWFQNRMGISDPKKREKCLGIVSRTLRSFQFKAHRITSQLMAICINSRRSNLVPIKAAMDSCITDDVSTTIGMHTILRHSGFQAWMQPRAITVSMAREAFTQMSMVEHRTKIMEMDSMWSLRKSLGDALVLIAIQEDLKIGVEQGDRWPFWWDGIIKKPKVAEADRLLMKPPVMNAVESTSTSAIRAAAMPTLDRHNTETISSIIKLATAPGLGGIIVEGEPMVDPALKKVLAKFIEASQTL